MFSVIVPVYNHHAFLAEAIWSALRSDLVSEVLLLDDGSRDNSRQLVASFAKRYDKIRDLTPAAGGNLGAPARLNELVSAARHEWIAVLNSDDAFVAGRFETIVADPRFVRSDLVIGNLLLMDGRGHLIGAKRGPFDVAPLFPDSFHVGEMVAAGALGDLLSHQNFVGSTSNFVFRKSLHARVGGFSSFRYVHDWDFALRATVVGAPIYVQRFLTAYRMHDTNTILEGAEKIDLEVLTLFERFARDYPEVVRRPAFQVGLERNVNVTRLRSTRESNGSA